MKLQTRIEGLERKVSSNRHTGPEIIFLRAAGIGGANESQPQLQSAIFVGFEREQLRAMGGETDYRFGTRAQHHLAGLKRRKDVVEHRRSEDGK